MAYLKIIPDNQLIKHVTRCLSIYKDRLSTKLKKLSLLSFFIIILTSQFNLVVSKGGAVIGGSAGGGQVCVDCNPGGNYTEEEMRVALIILIIILCIFFALCLCQCYNRMKYECNENSVYNIKYGSVPVAPYFRDSNNNSTTLGNNLANNFNAELNGSSNEFAFLHSNYNHNTNLHQNNV